MTSEFGYFRLKISHLILIKCFPTVTETRRNEQFWDDIWSTFNAEHHLFLMYYTNNIVEAFTARELQYDSDSLLALAGVLNHLRRTDACLKHVWDIPWDLNEKYNYDLQGGSMLACDIFATGLCWSHVQNCWDDSVKPRRKSTFPSHMTPTSVPPSWTWAGWASQVEWRGRRPNGVDTPYSEGFMKSVIPERHFYLQAGPTW